MSSGVIISSYRSQLISQLPQKSKDSGGDANNGEAEGECSEKGSSHGISKRSMRIRKTPRMPNHTMKKTKSAGFIVY
jgi:hypothetical protein